MKREYLECKPPFPLYTFTGPIKCKQLREAWIKTVRREPFDKKGSWQPATSDRVYFIDFVDGLANLFPIPTLFLGCESKDKKSRRTLFRKPLEKKMRESEIIPVTSTSQEEEVPLQANFIDENLDVNMEELNEPMEVIHEPVKIIPGDHTYCLTNNSTPYYASQDKSNLVKALVSKINKLTFENKQLKHRSIKKTSTFTWKKTKTDAKMKFYIGINTIVLFDKIFRLIQPFLSDINYWKGQKHTEKFSKVRHRRCNTSKKLSQGDEFLLTLMRLRLGLLNEDLAERFGVSSTLCSNIFAMWTKLLSKVLGKMLVVRPSKESIREHSPMGGGRNLKLGGLTFSNFSDTFFCLRSIAISQTLRKCSMAAITINWLYIHTALNPRILNFV